MRAARAAAALLLAAAASAAAADGARAARSIAVSDPGRLSRWAYLEQPTRAYARPSFRSRVLGRLALKTRDGTDELLFVEARRRVNGRAWVRVRLPLRPAGVVGWVPEDRLGSYQEVRTHLIINRRTLRATLVRRGRVVFRAPIGVGKPGTPTPRGRFYVRSRLTGFGNHSVYGPLAFGLSATSNVLTEWPGGGYIGIHGTSKPWLIPGRPSHGCVRMRNADIRRLDRLMSVGTPVTIR